MQRKGWLLSATLLLASAAPFASAAEDGGASTGDAVKQYLAAPAADYQVAQVATNPNLLTTGTTGDAPTSGSSSIQMSLAEPESDVLTRAAIDKLDAQIGSLTFKDTDLADVIRFIGKKLDLNFIFDSEVVKGKVTLTFRNVRVRDALNSILTAQKLAMVPDKSGIFRIVPQDRVGGREVETRTEVLNLNWVAAADVQKTMKPFLSEHGKMEINEASNVVIITDVPPNVENIKDLVAKVDLPERQVMIEARLIDINIDALRNLSANLSASKNNINDWQPPVLTSKTVKDGVPVIDTISGPPVTDALGVVNNLLDGVSVKKGVGTIAFGDTIGVLGNKYSLNAVFTALEQRRIVEILANPRVSTLNNVQANIDITQKIPYANSVSSPGGQTTEEIQFQEAGVKISVTPIITPNGFIRMNIEMHQKIDRGLVVAPDSANPLPPHNIDERNATTNVIVPSGSTAVLGGLRQLNSTESLDGTPWLHQIPLIGWLFKNKNNDQAKTELLLMISPKAIDKTPEPNAHEKELYSRIEKKWHLPDQFMDDTHNIDEEPIMHTFPDAPSNP